MFEPESDVQDAEKIRDPFMDDAVLELIERHKVEQQRWGGRADSARVDALRAQMLEFGELYAVQDHLYSTLQLVRDAYAEKGEQREHSGFSDTGSTMNANQIRDMRRRSAAMMKKPSLYHEVEEDDEESEEEDDTPKAVAMPKRAQETDGFDKDVERVRTHITEVNECIAEVHEPPKADRPLEALKRLAQHWMIPWEWADGVREIGESKRRCRVLFFGASMGKTEVHECTLYSTYSTAREYVEMFEKEGIARSEMLAMVGVPLFHSGRWGEYNQVPTAVLRIFMHYVRMAVLALKPMYIVTSTRPGTELVQRALNPDARTPDEWTPNLMDETRIGRGCAPKMLRVLHPMQVRNSQTDEKLREDALMRLAKEATPVKPVANAFDKLMGRAIIEKEHGGIKWVLGGSIAVSSFPTEEELAQMLRHKVSFIVNTSSRAVKGKAKSAWTGKEVRLDLDSNYLTLFFSLHDMLAALPKDGKIIVVCPTGAVGSVFVAAMFRVLLLGPFMGMDALRTWMTAVRGIPPSSTHLSTLYSLHEHVEENAPLPVKEKETAWAVSLISPSKNPITMYRCRTREHAALTERCLLEWVNSAKHPERPEWTTEIAPWDESLRIPSVQDWNTVLSTLERAPTKVAPKRSGEADPAARKKKKK